MRTLSRTIIRSVAVLAGVGCIAHGFAIPADASDTIDKRNFNIVGSWGVGTPYPRHERPFWSETLPKASNGRLTANIQSFDQLGLDGSAVFEMVQRGVYDIGASVIDYVSGDDPVLEGLDLPAVPDATLAKQVLDAYRPHLAKAFDQAYDAVLLAVIPQTPQVFFCKAAVNSLADLSGKRIRGSGRMTMDFIAAVGGVGVSLAFNETPVALDRGVVDCGVTGVLSGYTGGWSEVTSHLYPLPVGGWDHVGIIINKDVWDSLSAETQKLLRDEIGKMEAAAWAAIHNEFEEGINCNTGGDCPLGKPHGMKTVALTEADRTKALQLIEANVLPQWAARCSAQCVADWNASIGKTLGISAARK